MKHPIKKLKLITVAGALCLASLFSGCNMIPNLFAKKPELPANSESIRKYDADSIDMMLIDVGGRTYAPFGTVRNTMSNIELRDCIGYVDDDKSERVYTLCDDPFDNYLFMANVSSFMDAPMIWRDFATYNEDIFTPEFIDPSDYEEWGSSGCYSEMKEFTVDILMDADDVYELSMDYKVGGADCGVGGVRNADKTELNKGDVYGMSIAEIAIYEKFDKNEPLDVECYFHVETMDGQKYDLDYVYKDTVKFGDKISLTLTGNAKDGYVLK